MIRLPAGAGFTLIEILVSVAIIFLLTGLTLAGYGAFNKKQTVETAAYQLASDLRLAQQKAISGEKPVGCAGDLQSWQTVISSGSYYSTAICTDASPAPLPVIAFPSNVTSSTGTVAFFAITGAFDSATDVTYIITGNFSGAIYTNTIEITPSGGINVN